MDPDVALVLGLVLAAFSIPAMVSAFSDQRVPRTSAVLVLIAGGLVLWALNTRHGGYDWPDIPKAFVRVAAQLLN